MDYDDCINLENKTYYDIHCTNSCSIYCKAFLSMLILFCMYLYFVLCMYSCKLNDHFNDDDNEIDNEQLILDRNSLQIHNRQPPKYEDI